MKRSTKALTSTLLIAFAALALFVLDYCINATHMEQLVRVLPAPIRLYYLNRLFNEPTEDCFNCYSQLVGALRALEANASEPGQDFGFDPVRLVPLISQGAGFIREPVSGLACNVILLRGDRRVFAAMAQQFSQDPATLRSCLVGRASIFKTYHPAAYEHARSEFLKVESLQSYADLK